MKNNWIILIVIAVILVVGYLFLTSNKTVTSPPVDEQVVSEPELEAGSESVVLSEQNDSGELGTASLVGVDGQVVVTLSLTGFEVGVEQPAHIHIGACPDVGAVSYPLTNVVDGVSVTTLDVTLEQLKGEQPLAINVHESTDNPQNYVSCGDLAL
jgi:hypothetical protein